MEIGALDAIGMSWQDEQTMIDKLRLVTAEQVQDVARRYFSDDTLSVAVLEPQALDAPAPTASAHH